MTPQQVAVNHRCVRAAAERLTAIGYQGDAHGFVESLLLEAFASGYRPIEAPVPLTGSTSTPEAREAAKEALRVALDEAKRKRTAGPRTTPA